MQTAYLLIACSINIHESNANTELELDNFHSILLVCISYQLTEWISFSRVIADLMPCKGKVIQTLHP